MNPAASHGGPARHNTTTSHVTPTRTSNSRTRPASIAELAKEAMDDLWDESKDFKHYLRVAERYRREGKEYAKRGDLEGAFVQLARAATLVLEKLPLHKDYQGMLNENQRHNLSLNGQDILDNLSDLKPALVDRYDKWLQKHPDGVDTERTPSARTQKIASDVQSPARARSQSQSQSQAAQAQAQRDQFQAEERARQEREQRRRVAEEAEKWKHQREQNEQAFTRDEAERERARRREGAQAAARSAAARPPQQPDFSFSRTPMQNNGYGSQNTVVIADGQPPPPPPLSAPASMSMPGSGPDDALRQQQYQQQQEQMRLREEEITKRQAEQRRRQEADGIARRQQEAEEAARAAARGPLPPPSQPMQPQIMPQPQPQQQSLATLSSTASFSTTSGVSPMFPNYPGPSSSSSAVTTPSSNYYHPQQPPPLHTHIEYPSIPQPATALQEGYQRPLPLEGPSTYEGESTDSESVHHFKIGKPRPAVEHTHMHNHNHNHNHRTPVRNVRSPAYPAPITTTSPPPTIGYPALPLLMSQHQKTQGYFPSLNSMFSDTGDRHAHGGGALSALFGDSDRDARNGGVPFQSASLQPPQPYSNAFSSNNNGNNATTNNGFSRLALPPPPQSAPANINIPAPAPAPQIQDAASLSRLPIPPNAIFDPSIPLKTVSLPRECLPRFLAIAKVNTEMNRETCGLLLGKDKGHKYSVTTLLIPKQHSTSDTCTMDEEELVLQFTEERSLITLGWIHTHPSQSCFMSSVDLHTHSAFQRMLPESFAVVCAPKSNPNFGIFRLTDPPGLSIILNCEVKEAFHPHPDEPIYTDADKGHVQMKDSPLEIVDLR